jgi:hypothetical protein
MSAETGINLGLFPSHSVVFWNRSMRPSNFIAGRLVLLQLSRPVHVAESKLP